MARCVSVKPLSLAFLLDSEVLTDVTVVLPPLRLPCHKCVLANEVGAARLHTAHSIHACIA